MLRANLAESHFVQAMSAKKKQFPSAAAALAAPAVASAEGQVGVSDWRHLVSDYPAGNEQGFWQGGFSPESAISADVSGLKTSDLKVIPPASLQEVAEIGDLKAVLTLDLDCTQASLDGARVVFVGSLCIADADLGARMRAEVLDKIKVWKRSLRVTALDYFHQHIASVPKQHRPYAHEVRAANLPFYEAVRSAQLKAHSSIGELFEKMPGAQGRGGKLASKPIEPAEAIAILERKRNQDRERKRRQRAKAPPTP